jgi:hypothetical protein
MVNPNRVKNKIPSLLIDADVKSVHNQFMRKRTSILRFKRKQPQQFEACLTRVVLALKAFDESMEECPKR